MILALLFSIFVSHAAEVGPEDRAAIEVLVKNYVVAFDGVDYSALKKSVSEEYIDFMGGEAFRKAFVDRQKKSGRMVKDIRIEKFPIGIFVQFDIGGSGGGTDEIMKDDEWFRVVKESGDWKFQRKETDFYPGDQ